MADPQDPDAVLATLGRELEEAWKAERSVMENSDSEDEAKVDAAIDRSAQIVDQISKLPARTPTALRIKAQAYLWARDGDLAGEKMVLAVDHPAPEARVLASLLRDLLALKSEA